MGHLEQKQFVGSMAFNRFMQASPSSSSSPSTAATSADGDGTADGTSPNTADKDSSSTADTIGSKIEEAVDVAPPEGASHYNRNNEPGGDYTDEGDFVDDGYLLDSTYVPGGGGVFEDAKEVALNVLRRDSIVGSVAHSFVLDADGNRLEDAGGMERSGTTVTTTTDVSAQLSAFVAAAAAAAHKTLLEGSRDLSLSAAGCLSSPANNPQDW